jgi:hypothetical protein
MEREFLVGERQTIEELVRGVNPDPDGRSTIPES